MANTAEETAQLLLVDKDKSFQEFVSESLRLLGLDTVSAGSWEDALHLIKRNRLKPDIVCLDPLTWREEPCDLEAIRSQVGTIPLVILSSSSDPQDIVRAVRDGAQEYLCKPIDKEILRDVIRSVMSQRPASEGNSRLPSSEADTRSAGSSSRFVFANSRMRQIREMAPQLGKVSVPVLLQGESGVGKDVVARFIHMNSVRRDKPFVKVNCAALPNDLIESELFGHEKGAFTGAHAGRAGKFEYCDGGTIFLDEISEISPAAQAKLLQVIQDKKFSRLGSNRELQVDVRILAATNRNLEEAIENGSFRNDLYYRLNVVSIEIPPLRQRPDEICLLAKHFVKTFRETCPDAPDDLPKSLYDLFGSYHWPGNVRELENMVKRYLVLEDVESVRSELESKMSRRALSEIDRIAEDYLEGGATPDLKEAAKQAAFRVEKSIIIQALRRSNWNKLQTARSLKVSYKTLLSKIDQYAIHSATV